ncbi:hypothetical protein DESUT3_37550 [Desulfuromonas versatilis]|uniref:Peptidase S8/S53 domain-containing protein n=1 Tax=Desulfuromonas versatilis TaxID=2802975 RepID=A0ABN6E7H4_9BACT|nr:S8 family serine peptidase [Desulfuromonas versatilis]BCR06686.1 hypothetical protein DESUT3_37550 [Desulfuromonas versatilis]
MIPIQRGWLLFVVVSLLGLLGVPETRAGVVTPELQGELAAAAPADNIPVIVTFSERAELARYQGREKKHRRAEVVRALKARAEGSQRALRDYLRGRVSGEVKPLWVINGLALEVPREMVAELAAFPGVESVKLDALIEAPRAVPSATNGIEDNLHAVGVPELWNLGLTGTGMVIGLMDTGVDASHPDLVGRWRGGSNSWLDPNGEHATPFDQEGHGTAVAGVLVGGNAGGTSIGVAPDARWIAVKIFNDAGFAPLSGIHQGFQWMLDPDGNPDTDDAPDVVNNSWGFEDPAGSCIDGANPDPNLNANFHPDLQALRAAGIPVVFAAGNTGPANATSISPGNYPEAFAVGAVDTIASAGTILPSSARGPSACDGSIFPELVAPGRQILTSGLPADLGFVLATGTSFSAPHVAGIMALLQQGFPAVALSGLEATLVRTAADRGPIGPDNAYGAGLVNGLAAYQSILANLPPVAPALVFPAADQADLGTSVTFRWEDSTDPDGDTVSFRLLVADNPEFTDSIVAQSTGGGPAVLLAGLGGAGLLLLGLGGVSRRRRLPLALAAAALLLVSCGGGGGGGGGAAPAPQVTETSATVSGLQPATTYFWKVIAEDDRGGVTESAVQEFTTL